MKKFLILFLSFIMILSITACGDTSYLGDEDDEENDDSDSHNHVWIDATCSQPKTCKECGSTRGDPLEHNYEDNVCTLCGDKLPSKGLAYEVTESDGETYATVIGIGECTDTDIVIESTYEGYPVTHIAANAFYANSQLTSVVISDSVTTIETNAFYSCDSLVSVRIGQNVTWISDYVFDECNALTTVIIPQSVAHMGYNVFDGYNLSDIYCEVAEQPEDWESWWNESDATVHWGLDINWEYVDGTPAHKHVWIDATCTQAQHCDTCGMEGEQAKGHVWIAVNDCYTATTCNVCGYTEGGARGHNFVDGSCADCHIPQPSEGLSYEFESKYNGYIITGLGDCQDTDIIFPDMYKGYPIISITHYAFQNEKSIESIFIPARITSIGGYAFANCTNLKEVTLSDGIKNILDYAFLNCTGLTTITIPGSVSSLTNCVFEGCTQLTEVILCEGLTNLGGGVFYNCTNLSKVVLPNSLTKIDYLAFYNCTSLEEIQLPPTLTFIGDYAFYNCTRLKELQLPSTLTFIGDYAFQNCDSLSSLIIPSSVTKVCDYIFYDCDGLNTVYCEAAECPADWTLSWNHQDNAGTTPAIIWGYTPEQTVS